MPFDFRLMQLAKDAEHPEENQDVAAVDQACEAAAVADGVSSAIFSRDWAEILTHAVLAEPLDPRNLEATPDWLDRQRRQWEATIDTADLSWFQKPKLREGAFSTLVWVRLFPPEPDKRGWLLHAFAIGDSCLFLARPGRPTQSFPIERSEQLEADPVVLGSVDLGRDHLLDFEEAKLPCEPGDLLVLCTDAVACWALQRSESGVPVDWEHYWSMDEQAWREELTTLREARQMRYDDATLLLLRVTEDAGGAVELQTEDVAEVARLQTEAATDPNTSDTPGPPPLPDPTAGQAWQEKLHGISDQVTEQVGDGLSWGLRKLRQAAEKAEEKLKQARKKRDDKRSDDEV